MAQDPNAFDRRRVLGAMACAGTGVVCVLCKDVISGVNLVGRAHAAEEQGAPVISLFVGDHSAFFWQRVLAGAQKAGRDLGVTVQELAGTGKDVDAAINGVRPPSGSKPAAVVVAAANVAALRKQLGDEATRYKFIAIGATSDTAGLTSLLATDQVKAGALAADILAERIQKTYADAEGDVAIISVGEPALDERAQGFKQQIKSKFGALDIVAHEGSNGEADAGQRIMAKLIDAHHELRGVFVSNAALAYGAAQSLSSSKTNKTGDRINLVCFDFDETILRLLRDDTMAAIVVQDPFRMGYEGVKTALAASKGEAVAATIDTGAQAITRGNIGSARAQELLGIQ